MSSLKMISQDDIPCTYFINETFPTSSITVAGKKAATSFQKTVTSLKINETYLVKFYQLNDNFSVIPQSGYWNVNFSGITKKSPYAVTARNRVWKEVTFTFVATSNIETITFTNTKGFSYTNSTQRLLLADIRLHLQGECVFDSELICEDVSSFKPKKSKKYVVSGWVKEERAQQIPSYTSSGIRIDFGTPSDLTFHPSGDIIDGWQLIQGIFETTVGASAIKVALIPANDGVTTYFDDIRVHPFNGNMKSFVYAQDTQRLMAELDENNYATFYEYDQEGGLVRVKKETEKGVYTIQETRSGNSKLTTQRQ